MEAVERILQRISSINQDLSKALPHNSKMTLEGELMGLEFALSLILPEKLSDIISHKLHGRGFDDDEHEAIAMIIKEVLVEYIQGFPSDSLGLVEKESIVSCIKGGEHG